MKNQTIYYQFGKLKYRLLHALLILFFSLTSYSQESIGLHIGATKVFYFKNDFPYPITYSIFYERPLLKKGIQRLVIGMESGVHFRSQNTISSVPSPEKFIKERHYSINYSFGFISNEELSGLSILYSLGLRKSRIESSNKNHIDNIEIENQVAYRNGIRLDYQYKINDKLAIDFAFPLFIDLIEYTGKDLRLSLSEGHGLFGDRANFSANFEMGIRYVFRGNRQTLKIDAPSKFEDNRIMKNSLFLELGGYGIVYSLNYERILYLNNKTGLRFSLGGSYINSDLISLPLQASIFQYSGRNSFGIGIGFVKQFDLSEDIGNRVHLHLRYIYAFKNNRNEIGFAINPIIYMDTVLTLFPWASLRYGYKF